jgi:glycosyltransferase involved in cell wall biosynthesis
MRVAMVTTHPIQYQVPWLQRLAARPGVDLHVYFAMLPDAEEQGREFGVSFSWDIPLLEGYSYSVLENRSKRPSLTEFGGCDTPGIRSEIRNGGYDAVIVNGWVVKTCLQALLACRLTGTPCIVRAEVNGLFPRAAWKQRLHSVLLAQYAAHLSIGTNNRNYLLGRGVPAKKIFPTPYCIDNQRFGDASDAWLREEGKTALRQRFGLEPDRTVFLFSGKFVEKKRPGDIIEALCRLSSEERDRVQVLMVGGGPLEDRLREAADGLPVKFAGFLNQSEIAAAYALADCLLLPSEAGETWGLVVNEAMACGLPVFASNQVGSAIDLVQDGHTGFVHRCGDTVELAELLGRFGGNAAELARMGAEARARVAEYNFDRVVSGVEAALESVVVEKGR